MEEHTYEVDVAWDHDRKGTLTSPVLPQSIEVATPPEFNKGMKDIWSPEHLLIAAAESCLMTTFLSIAENSKLEFKSFTCKAKGKLGVSEGKYMMTEIILSPVVVLKNEEDKDKAMRVLQKSEAACLISNSIKSIFIFQPEVTF